MKPVRIDPEARDEIRSSGRRYEREREGLGADFRQEVEDAIARARRVGPDCRPVIGVPRDLGVLRVRLRRFPYQVVFIELERYIRVLAVAHERRRPGYWSQRV
jgi:hypothetical protein